MHSLGTLLLVGVLAVFLGLAGGAMIAALWVWVGQVNNERDQMAEKISSIESEIEIIRTAGPKRHTHATAAGLEDALGIAIDVLEEYASSQRYTEARLRQLHSALQKVREGPHAYQSDSPSNKRPNRRHENV